MVSVCKILQKFFLNNLSINPLFHYALFLYPLKTPENLTVFWCFQGVEKGGTGNKWVNNNDTKTWTMLLSKATVHFLLCRIAVMKKLAKSKPKYLWWNHFSANHVEARLYSSYFPVNFAKSPKNFLLKSIVWRPAVFTAYFEQR